MLGALRTIALATLLLCSCHRPPIGSEAAQDYFATHRTELTSIVERVQDCQPDGGRIDAGSNFRCWSSAGAPANIVSAIEAADVPWIRVLYNEREGEPRELSKILIAMPSSFGTSYAGVTEAFVYEVEPATETAYVRTDYRDGAYIERLPVTDAPHHWYWEMIHR